MAYPASLWAKIKTDYETGNFSALQLQKKYKIGHSSIEHRSLRKGWQKGLLIPAIEKSIQEKFITAFTKRAFDENRVAEIVDKMANAITSTRIKGVVAKIPNWTARDKAVTQYAELTGSYATVRHDLTSAGKPLPTVPGVLEVVIKNVE